MKTYNIIYGDSAAGNLKQSFKLAKKKQKIIRFSDDLSIGPIKDYFSNNGKTSRNDWILNELYKYGRNEYFEDFKIYLKESEKDFLNDLVKINKNDKVIFWFGNNTQDTLFLGYVLKMLEECKNIFYVDISDNFTFNVIEENYARSIAETNPEYIKQFIGSELKFNKEKNEKYINNFLELTKTKGNLRQLLGNEVREIEENFYDQFIFDFLPLEYKKAASIIGESMGKCFQILSDVFVEYRLNKLIEGGIIKYKGSRVNMRDYSVKINNDLFRNFETKDLKQVGYKWQNASEILPVDGSNVFIGMKIEDTDGDIHKIISIGEYNNFYFTDQEGLSRLPLLVQKGTGIFSWRYVDDFPENF